MTGVDFTGKRYDMGSKLGVMQAQVETALRHAEIGEEFRSYLKQLARLAVRQAPFQKNEKARIKQRILPKLCLTGCAVLLYNKLLVRNGRLSLLPCIWTGRP